MNKGKEGVAGCNKQRPGLIQLVLWGQGADQSACREIVFAGWDGSGLACHKESRTGMMIISTSLNYHCMQS